MMQWNLNSSETKIIFIFLNIKAGQILLNVKKTFHLGESLMSNKWKESSV